MNAKIEEDAPASEAVRKGRVVLVGAGPGDPELITERGARALAEADAVLYDALVHPLLLERCKPSAEKFFVGKRAGAPSERQARISARLVELALEGKDVVRLKGGDPFLFGRAVEELDALVHAGINFEVIPGVPSPLAVAAYAGIPLTDREVSSSIGFVTATEADDKEGSSHDWSKLATATETLVVFMGTRRMARVMALLIEHGRDPKTPVAVVEWASMPRQRVVVGDVSTIADLARAENIGLPALTIVGEVVKKRHALRWYENKPLFGKRALVLRAEEQAGALASKLRDAAAEPVLLPVIRIDDPKDVGALDDAAGRAATYDWVVFTSANGVERFFGALDRIGRDGRAFGKARVCAIGPATAKALRGRGIAADLVPDEYRGEAVADAILVEHGRAGSISCSHSASGGRERDPPGATRRRGDARRRRRRVRNTRRIGRGTR
jgi:uroporphyrinogen III methyltransferase/synthase